MKEQDKYASQYKHPNWQKKRLECLSAAEFTCQACGETENMLHVHHKRYVSGRKVWEYGNDDLEVLCEDCHESVHHAKRKIDAFLSRIPQSMLPGVCGLLSGWLIDFLNADEVVECYNQDLCSSDVGELAFIIGSNCTETDISDLVHYASPSDFADLADTVRLRRSIVHGQD